VTGVLKMRTYLSGMPECKLGLNDKVHSSIELKCSTIVVYKSKIMSIQQRQWKKQQQQQQSSIGLQWWPHMQQYYVPVIMHLPLPYRLWP
jgi:hypothetical protein